MMDASIIQARAATLRKTGNLLGPKPPPPVSTAPKPVAPRPVAPKRVAPKPVASRPRQVAPSQSFDDLSIIPKKDSFKQRSQTMRFITAPRNEANPYENSIPLTEHITSPSFSEDYIPEDAYDDIDSVREQMQLFKEGQPPPLPPANLKSPVYTPQPKVLLKRSALVSQFPPRENILQTPSLESLNVLSHVSSKHSLPSEQAPEQAPMSIRELIKRQHEFPLQVKVFQGTRKCSTISKGELYDVHFIKTTEVVRMATENGVSFHVPLNSAILFGAVYYPDGLHGLIRDYVFNTAGEIMSSQNVPPLVYAQKTFDTSSIDTSVQAGEILIVKQVNKQRRFRGKTLLCTVAGTNHSKQLIENCDGSFSTAPHDVKLHLPEIVHHLSLPLKCVLYYEGLNAQDVTPQLPGGIVTLQELQTLHSLIVTRSTGVSGRSTDTLLELQLDTDILVEVISTCNPQMKTALEERSRKLYDSFSPAIVDSVSLLTSESSYQLQKQAMFYSIICYDSSLSCGIAVQMPQLIKSKNSSFVPDKGDGESAYQYPDKALAGYQAEKMKMDQCLYSPDSEYDVPQLLTQQMHVQDEKTYDTPRAAPSTPLPIPVSVNKPNHLQKEIEILKAENKSLQMTMTVLEKMIEGILTKTGSLHQHNQSFYALLQNNFSMMCLAYNKNVSS